MKINTLKRFWAATCAAALLAADPGLLAAAATLEGVEVGADEITVHLSEKVKFNAFTTSEPPRLVLELLDTEHVASTEYTPGQGKYLKRVRSGQYQREPDLISRVVLYLSDLVAYRASWDDSRLIIGLVPSDLPRKAAEVAAAVAAPTAEPVEAAEVGEGEITLNGVDVDASGVTIRLSGKTKFNAFTTEDPARLVVELEGTRHATTSDYIPGKGGVIGRVRSGQFQPEPDLTSRVVLYLNEMSSYGASWKGSDLRVTLITASAKQPAPERAPMVLKPKSAMKAAPVSVEAVPVPVPAPVPVPVVAAAAPPPPPPPPPAVAFKTEPVPVPAPKKKTRADSDMPETMTTTASSELESIARAKDYDRVDEVVGTKEAEKVVGAPAKKSDSAKLRRDIIATLPTDPVTLDFDDMDVRDVLKLLATKAKINVVYGNEVSGMMTLHLRDVPFNEAFMTALSMEGLIPVQVGGNILRVVTPASLATQRASGINQTKVIGLRYAKGADLLAAVSAVRAAEGRTGSVVHDKGTNSFVITDSLEGIASLERMLADLDVRPQQVLIEAKLVEVTLTKDVHFGIQWDYFSADTGKLIGQEGTNFIGTPAFPRTSPVSKPFDGNNIGITDMTSGLTGAAGRGTGVSLPANAVAGALTLGRVTNNYFLNATITAAANRGKAKVLSDPKVTTLDGQAATINITTQIPYVTSSVSSTGVATEAVSFVTTGITMAVTPTINADGRVHLLVNPTVSQPSATAASAGSTGAPAVDSRSATTNVMVRDGETIVIGGLITDQVNDVIAKIPLLGDIPLLGWFFKKKSKTRTRVELLIFVTTRIVNT